MKRSILVTLTDSELAALEGAEHIPNVVARIIAGRLKGIGERWDAEQVYAVKWHDNGVTCSQTPASTALLEAAETTEPVS